MNAFTVIERVNRRSYVRLPRDLWSTEALRSVSGTALAVYVAALAIAALPEHLPAEARIRLREIGRVPGGRTNLGLLVHANGAIYNDEQLASHARVEVETLREALIELTHAGALYVAPTGAYGLVGFRHTQETPDAARKRRQRARGR